MTAFEPMISIIVPVRNFERTLAKTFEYLLNVEYPREKMEILIADGGSTDGTVDIIKEWQKKYSFITLVEIPNCPSPGYARNKALDKAKGEFLFFTDGDCAPCKEWITEMLKHFEKDPQIGMVGGEINTLKTEPDNILEDFCERTLFNHVASRYATDKGFREEGYFPPLSDMSPSEVCGHRAFFFVTANVAIRKTAIDKGNHRFWARPTGEDMEFNIQLKKDGWKQYFTPKADVKHMHRASYQAMMKVWKTYAMAHGPLLEVHATKKMDIVFQFVSVNMPNIRIPFPIKGFIYFGNFHMMNIFGLITIFSFLSALCGSGFSLATGLVSLALTAWFFYKFNYWVLKWPKKNLLKYLKLKYMSNLMFCWGGLLGGLKHKSFCIEPSFG
ncbi:MAG: glycosyltransferase [Candidatus Aureabacteria bacterium]|nr:glycosyltransferase [Candidatus Auribacterota bacterium]